MRVKRGYIRKERRKRILALAKGFKGKRNSCFRIAKERVMKALRNAYIGRKLRKRDFRSLWIVRVGAASRAQGLAYSRFMQGIRDAGIALNRKMLADLAVRDEKAFDQLVKLAKANIS